MDTNVNVLILEDSKVLNNFLFQRFSSDNYFKNVYQAFTLREAKRILATESINYLILDLSLPDGSGAELLKAKTHTIVLTATTDLSTRDTIFKKGAIDYFSKKDRLDLISKNIISLIKKIEKNKKFNVLIVDDSDTPRKQNKAIFKIRNYNVLEASNGKEALEIIEKKRIDLIILDLEMPIMGGEELLEEIKKLGKDDEIGIIVSSGTSDRDLISRVLKNGANEFIKKPFSVEEIYLRSEIAFNQAKAQRELKRLNSDLKQRVNEEVEKNLRQEKQLVQKSDTDAMGDMMSAIIDQWKQPLAYLFSCCASLKNQDTPLEESAIKEVNQIESQVRYMKSSLDDFSDFFNSNEMKRYDLNQTAEKVVKTLIRPFSMIGVKLVKKNKMPIYTIGYSAQIQQVLMNIINNSRDAIVNYQPKHKVIEVNVGIQDNSAVITVTDFAGGIPTDMQEDIFKSSLHKDGKKHTNGISLEMSKTIVEKVGGKVYAKNIQKGDFKGARFIIELPISI
jgi:DNA-binding response OmpR family regulator